MAWRRAGASSPAPAPAAGIVTSSMTEAKAELTEEREKSRALEDKDEDEIVEERLQELADLMSRVRGCRVLAVAHGRDSSGSL